MLVSINKVNWLPMATKITLILRVWEMAFVAGKYHLWAEVKYQTTAKVFLDHIPADEGATFPQTVGNHTPNNTASLVTRVESST
jgi:hypothetical protein